MWAEVQEEAVEQVRAYWRGRVDAYLCNRSLVTEADWTAMFLRLVADVALLRARIGRIGNPMEDVGFDPREPLVWTWCVLESMPNARAVAYEALRERSADGTGIEDRAEALRHRGYTMAGPSIAVGLQVPWLAALARVLDDDLAALQYWPDDISAWKSDDWRPPGYGCFVVPVRRAFRVADGRPAQRRGLVQHAVIPERIGSLAVDLRLHPDAAPDDEGADPARWVYGAASFPDMTVVPILLDSERFRIAEALFPGDEEELLARQVSEARTASTDVLVWPELTMPNGRLECLRAALAGSPLLGRRIPIVVAGSWHVWTAADMLVNPSSGQQADAADRAVRPQDDAALVGGSTAGIEPATMAYVNRSTVMLGDGERLLSCDKRRPFPYKGRTEDIRPGNTLPVIVMEDRLIGVAICRDNCDDNATECYRHLPLDLIVVPSMGAESTVEAHERHAKAQRSRQGTVTLVVQQRLAIHGEPRPTGASAFSFVRPEEDVTRPALEQDVPFRTLG